MSIWEHKGRGTGRWASSHGLARKNAITLIYIYKSSHIGGSLKDNRRQPELFFPSSSFMISITLPYLRYAFILLMALKSFSYPITWPQRLDQTSKMPCYT
ncbi:hypothetical protein Agabi119p4_8530 [Agaricus bisporus var. burnettii]|uniref:Uncharacterized protein n=1 Tax=Agaricus bisporus var. burnettii TaxID=192524 RepID=A0A8H7EYI9_AGABI|nr:hypothetical protein Agabi119p4_8530 [Agaricus bisporus var. burnettii]